VTREQSLQRIDPLGAMAGRRLTIAAALGVLVLSLSLPVLFGGMMRAPVASTTAAGLMIASAVLLVIRTGHRRLPLSRALALSVLALALLAQAIAAFGRGADEARVQWAPYTVAILLLAMVPYRPIRDIVAMALVSAGWVGVVTTIALASEPVPVPGFEQLVAVVPVLALPLSGAVFVRTLLSYLRQWRTDALASTEDEARKQEVAITRAVQQSRVSILNLDVVPFYSGLVERREVTADDIDRARDLASSIRDVMVADTGRSWLDDLLMDRAGPGASAIGPSLVRDPADLARWMDIDQRAALRAMVGAIRDTDHSESLGISLRSSGSSCHGLLVTSVGTPHREAILRLRPYLAVVAAAFSNFSYETIDETLEVRFSYERP
jgi:hypothetical protein